VIDYRIINIQRTSPVVANKCTCTFDVVDFVDRSVTYPDGTVADWGPQQFPNVSLQNVDVSGADIPSKQASCDAYIQAWFETVAVPQIRARRAAAWALLPQGAANTTAPDIIGVGRNV
jgi:hypothetical protein